MVKLPIATRIYKQRLEAEGFKVEVTKTHLIARLKGGGGNPDFEKKIPLKDLDGSKPAIEVLG